MRTLTNSKSGSFFFYSADYRFVLKTCTKREATFLLGALPQYYQHLMDNRFTLLCRIFGLHRVASRGDKRETYFVVMGNVFPIDKPIHERYDLKGSWIDRHSGVKAAHGGCLKDMDMHKPLCVSRPYAEAIFEELKHDSELVTRRGFGATLTAKPFSLPAWSCGGRLAVADSLYAPHPTRD